MNKIKEIFLYANWKNIIFALIGSAILAFGTNYFYANSKIPEAGIMGLCLIIENLTGLNAALANIIITIFCYILAWRLLGTKYILNTSVAAIGFSAFYALFSSPALDGMIPSLEEYPLLAALLGAIVVEVGTGIITRYGSATSADQALIIAIAKRGSFDLSWLMFIKDIVVITLPIIYIDDPINVVYSIAIMTLTAPINDYIINAPKNSSFKKRIKRKKNSWIAIMSVGLAITALISAIAFYLQEFLPATEQAYTYATSQGIHGSFTIEYFYEENDQEDELEIMATAYVPTGEIKAGFLYYPGGKVDCDAYAPLLSECASEGILCVIVKMPFNLAVFGINKGLDVLEILPYDVDNWYIGGHSLGGSMAANCAANHPGMFNGIIFLASYSSIDVSDYRVLSIYGSEDEVMEHRNYEKYKKNFPNEYSKNLIEIIIDGGNHSGFGMYGTQKGDGIATISNVDQIKITADSIIDFIITE